MMFVDQKITPFVVFAGLVLVMFVLQGCASGIDKTLSWSDAKLYREAKESQDRGLNQQAQEYYTHLQARYPYSQYSEDSQIQLAKIYFDLNQKEEAIAELDRFARLYPDHAKTDYVLYFKGLINYPKKQSFFEWFTTHPNAALRDPAYLKSSLQSFSTLVKRFPKSVYVPKAKVYISNLRNYLAEHEFSIAEFYFNKQAYVASLNRSIYVLRTYPGSLFAEKAQILVNLSNEKLGLPQVSNEGFSALRQKLEKQIEVDSVSGL